MVFDFLAAVYLGDHVLGDGPDLYSVVGDHVDLDSVADGFVDLVPVDDLVDLAAAVLVDLVLVVGVLAVRVPVADAHAVRVLVADVLGDHALAAIDLWIGYAASDFGVVHLVVHFDSQCLGSLYPSSEMLYHMAQELNL